MNNNGGAQECLCMGLWFLATGWHVIGRACFDLSLGPLVKTSLSLLFLACLYEDGGR